MIFLSVLLISVIAIADLPPSPMVKVFESVRQCVPAKDPETLMACLKPHVTSKAQPSDLARLSMHLGAFESMSRLRTCTPKDLERFPIEASQGEALLCSSGKKRKRQDAVLWRFREEEGRWVISDVKLR